MIIATLVAEQTANTDKVKVYLLFVSEDDNDAMRSRQKFCGWLDEKKVKYYIPSPRAIDVHGATQLETALRGVLIEDSIMGLLGMRKTEGAYVMCEGSKDRLYIKFMSDNGVHDTHNGTIFNDWLNKHQVHYTSSSPRHFDVNTGHLWASLAGTRPPLRSSFQCRVLDHTTDESYMTVVHTPGEALSFVMEASRLTWDQPSTVDAASIMAVHTTALPHGGWTITVVASYEGTTQVYTAILTP